MERDDFSAEPGESTLVLRKQRLPIVAHLAARALSRMPPVSYQ